MRHLLILAILVGPAHAETQVSVRWGNYTEAKHSALVRLHGADDATVDNVTVYIHGDARSVHATLGFTISTRHRDARAIHLPIELSAGTAVTGMAYSIGGEALIEAIQRDAGYALSNFEAVVRRGNDPALLRRVAHDFKRDKLDLAVFPITRGMPARVTIELTLPPATHLVLDPGPRSKQQLIELSQPSEPSTTPIESYVDSTMSLYAGDEPVRQPTIEHRLHVMPTVSISDRRYELRKQIRAHATELGHCYALGAILDPTQSSAAQLTIDIAANGTIDSASASVGNADVRRCVVNEISSWLFAETDHARRVRQDVNLADIE
jgi:hypothetical protein